ncbi:MAG: hypothetical protein F6K25_17935 [Okeania sp. SIO2G4]|nr:MULTISPECIES: hypothetical protein [Okeania]NEQ92461.1 hypothetical protein [Okeania sp. SIO2G4]
MKQHKPYTLKQIIDMTGGVNPLDIPDETPDDDERIQKLEKIKFIG